MVSVAAIVMDRRSSAGEIVVPETGSVSQAVGGWCRGRLPPRTLVEVKRLPADPSARAPMLKPSMVMVRLGAINAGAARCHSRTAC